MKKEHFGYISNLFNLSELNITNSPENWEEGYEGKIKVSSCKIDWNVEYGRDYRIVEGRRILFMGYQTYEQALQTLEHMKSTEILFL